MLNTPYYLLDLEKLKNNLYSMQSAFGRQWPKFKIGYSFKTNNLPWLVSWFRTQGVYAEVVSTPEYELAKITGYDDDRIILNGPHKGNETLLKVMKNGGIVNLDSFEEIEFLTENAEELKDAKVGLRINFDLEKECPGETIPGQEPGRFGFNLENGDFGKAVNMLKACKNIKIAGIHGHHSTRTKSLGIFTAITNAVCKAAQEIEDLEYLDMGGCIFGDKPGAPSFDEYAETITGIMKKHNISRDVTLIMEPGAALVASPFSYVCKVTATKDIKGTRLVFTDGSKKHIAPQMNNISFACKLPDMSDRQTVDRQVISGYSCIEMDRFAEIKNGRELLKDDMIEVMNCGAYTISLAPLFIEYFPQVVVKDNGELTTVREAWGTKEFLQKNIIIK